jgi:hypothetical protein
MKKYEINEDQVRNISAYIRQVSVPVLIGLELGKIPLMLEALPEIKKMEEAPVPEEASKKPAPVV